MSINRVCNFVRGRAGLWSAALALLAILVALSTLPAMAQAPTATPTEQMFAASDLLNDLAVRNYTFNGVGGLSLNVSPEIHGVVQGGGWWATFMDIILRAGAGPLFLGAILLLFIVFVIVSVFIKRTGNARTAITSSTVYRNFSSTRTDFRRFRSRR